jgi:bacteriocin biosynthesis cyclodehydratase domain-containing protein
MEIMLRLSRAAKTQPTGADNIFWIAESGQGIWSSPGVGTLVSLLDPPADRETILGHYPAQEQRECAAGTLDRLIALGLVESASCPSHLAETCRELGAGPQSLERKRWTEGAILMAGDQPTGEALAAAFTDAGLPQGKESGLRVIAVADYLDPRLETVNQQCRKARTPWMLVKMVGEQIWLGPIFHPGEPPCWRCLAERLREKRWLESQLADPGDAAFIPYASPNRLRAAAEFVAQEAARWLLDAPGALVGRIRSFSWSTLEGELHCVSRHGNCASCRPDGSQSGHVQLRSVVVEWSPPGEVRTHSAQKLLEQRRALASPITGILDRLQRYDLAPESVICTYGAVHNIALPPKNMRAEVGLVQPMVCSGFGWTPEDAEVACLAEGIERYSIQFRGDERRVAARSSELGESAIHPNRVLLFSEDQYRSRDEWNQGHDQASAVPERFDPEEEIEWMRGWSLTSDCERFLPMAVASLRYRPPGKRWIGSATSTGCAGGACLEEATLHGLFELVERDALAIWWYNQIQLPAYDATALDDSRCRPACRQLGDQGWRVWVQEITTDLEIPVIVAIGTTPEGQWIRGSGAHLHKATAVRRAVSELYQLSRAKSRSGPVPAYSRMESGSLDTGSLTERKDDLKELVDVCCRKLKDCGHEVMAFDMTRPEIGFPVVRVVAPGLRPDAPRFAPGRLYDTPVRMGWLCEARAERGLTDFAA